MELLSIQEDDRILVIAPHPDDECIGAGGLLLRYPEQCDVIVLTDGCHGRTAQYTKEEISNIREKEFILEMKTLGIKTYKMLKNEDRTLFQVMDCLLDENLCKYTKIFVPYKNDEHPDHRAAFQILIRALKKQNLFNIEVYQYEITTRVSNATHGIILEKGILDKLRIISIHKSQIEQRDYCSIAKNNNAYRGKASNVKYIEGYMFTDLGDENISEQTIALEQALQKQTHFVRVYNKWTEILIENRDIAQYFRNCKYEKVAIYGCSAMGKNLNQLLNKLDDIHVEYIIDKQANDKKEMDVEIIKPSNKMRKIDVIIVAVVHDYRQIKAYLKELGYENVISLEDMIDNLRKDY